MARTAYVRWAIVAIGLAASPPALAAELSGLLVGATAEERVQDDALFGAGRDLVTVIAPEIGYAVAGPRLTGSLRYDADLYDYFGDTSQLDVDHHGYLHLNWLPAPRLKLQVDGTLQRVTDPLALDRLGVPRLSGESPVVYSAAALELDDRIAERWTARFGYQMQIAHFEQPGFIDGSTHVPWAAIERRLSSADDLGLELRTEIFLRVSDPEAFAETPALDWRHRLAPTLRLELAAGPVAFQAVGAQTAWVPYAAGGFVWTLQHGEIELRAGRDLVGATGFGVLWADYVEGGWVGRIAGRWSARLGGTYFLNGLAPDQATAVSGYGVEAALDFTPARDWRVEAAVDRVDQTSTVAQLEALDLGLDVAALRVVYHWGSDRRLR
ncbi:MAG TPA: hypothetical protein VMB50_12140 [Myxococcales bacterium]|nr:hypothetical protein [Myxococcales bacterium]